MVRKAVSGITLIPLLISMLTLPFNIQSVEASGTIYIRTDGRIEPSTAPISTVDNITYTFTGNIYDSIVVERDNIVVDGASYALQGTGSGVGIDLLGRSNVTIKNMEIKAFDYGITFRSSLGNGIVGNKITNNYCGIYLYYSSNNSMARNKITNNTFPGILLENSSNNTISGNNITNNVICIWLYWSSNYNSMIENNITNNKVGIYLLEPSDYNRIIGNNITNNMRGTVFEQSSNNSIIANHIANNEYGIEFYYSSSNNSIYHNNFVNNTRQVSTFCSTNVWDDGYPPGGNYWSDYKGLDLSSGSYQNETGCDGIGDAPYIIDRKNRDNYPLIHPYGSIRNLNTNLTYLTIQSAINALETLNGHTIFVRSGVYYEHVVVNKSLALFGENRETTIIDGGGVGNVTEVVSNSVTIRYFTVKNSEHWLSGIVFSHVKNCIVSESSLRNNFYGILLQDSSNSSISDNTITENYEGIVLSSSLNNTMFGNEVTANYDYGIVLSSSSNNTIYHNNFINNYVQVMSINSINTWDDGYPSGGNYWSEHNPPDLQSGPYQNETGSDRIGDIQYVIDENNTDRYPLIFLYGYVPSPDLNDDTVVDIFDLVTVANAFGSIPGDLNWNPIADLNQDEVTDIFDIVAVAIHFE